MDVDPREDGPEPRAEESPGERLNRNWSDILEELKIIQAGSQIITGFLLAAAFQQRFQQLEPTGLVLYLALVVVAVATTVLGMTPVILHRRLFRAGRKASLVAMGNRLAAAALVGVAVTLIGIVLLIFDLVGGIVIGLVAGVVTAVGIGVLWWILVRRVAGSRLKDADRGTAR